LCRKYKYLQDNLQLADQYVKRDRDRFERENKKKQEREDRVGHQLQDSRHMPVRLTQFIRSTQFTEE
jgi:hypothetical protein